MSCTPKTLAPDRCTPTRAGRAAQLLPDWSLTSVTALAHEATPPHGNDAGKAPRAAYSHSRSLGRRLATERQKASASRQCTHETGSSGSPASKVHVALARAGREHAPPSTHVR